MTTFTATFSDSTIDAFTADIAIHQSVIDADDARPQWQTRTEAERDAVRSAKAAVVPLYGIYADWLDENELHAAASFARSKADYYRSGCSWQTLSGFIADREAAAERDRQQAKRTAAEMARKKAMRARAKLLRPVREFLGCGSAYRIDIIDGDSKPALVGHSYHWTNRSGDVIRHPSAYARKGWSSLCYSPSTRRIEVGREWLLARGINVAE